MFFIRYDQVKKWSSHFRFVRKAKNSCKQQVKMALRQRQPKLQYNKTKTFLTKLQVSSLIGATISTQGYHTVHEPMTTKIQAKFSENSTDNKIMSLLGTTYITNYPLVDKCYSHKTIFPQNIVVLVTHSTGSMAEINTKKIGCMSLNLTRHAKRHLSSRKTKRCLCTKLVPPTYN